VGAVEPKTNKKNYARLGGTCASGVILHRFLTLELNEGEFFVKPPAALPQRNATSLVTELEADWTTEPIWTIWRGDMFYLYLELCTVPRLFSLYPFHSTAFAIYICFMHCATSRKVPGSIPGVAGIFSVESDSSMCPGVDSASKNEYQVNVVGKGGRCVRLTTYHHTVPLSSKLGA
jgi:hypothetical protein